MHSTPSSGHYCITTLVQHPIRTPSLYSCPSPHERTGGCYYKISHPQPYHNLWEQTIL